MKPVKMRRKAIEGKRRRYDKSNHRQKRPADRQRCGGARRRRRLKENAGAMIKETNVKTLPRTTSVAEGETKKGENQHEMEKRHYLQSRRGGVPS